VVQPTATCSATPTAPSTPDRVVASTDGAETRQLIVEPGACLVATMALNLPLSSQLPPLRLRPVQLPPGMTDAAARTSTEPRVMRRVLTVAAAPLTGKFH
jgi:hypothetical protein